MLQLMLLLQLQQRFGTADLRERSAQYAEYAAFAAYSESLLAPDKACYVSAMSSSSVVDEGKMYLAPTATV